MNIVFFLISSLVIGYALGTIPFGIAVAFIARRKNILKMGNKRHGAANVFREIGPAAGIATGFLDTLKSAGTAAVLLHLLDFPAYTLLPGALGALAGHNWPLFLKFRGGEGVSVTMGIYLFFAPAIMGLMLLLYLFLCGLWFMKIRPFYRYHMFNWQTVFCCAPGLVYIGGDGWVLSFWGIPFDIFFLLSMFLGLARLLKQIQMYETF